MSARRPHAEGFPDERPLALRAAPEAVAEAMAAPLPVLGASPEDEVFVGEENPVLSYLGRLSEGSRRTMRGSLEEIARICSGGEVGALAFPWWRLRGTRTAVICGALAETYAPATANRMLSAMKGVMKACFRLGLMTADDRDRASDVAPVRGTRPPPGRSIPRGELRSLSEVRTEHWPVASCLWEMATTQGGIGLCVRSCSSNRSSSLRRRCFLPC